VNENFDSQNFLLTAQLSHLPLALLLDKKTLTQSGFWPTFEFSWVYLILWANEIISMHLENQALGGERFGVKISLLLEVEARGPRFGVLPQLQGAVA
jgi:hypothetical protein